MGQEGQLLVLFTKRESLQLVTQMEFLDGRSFEARDAQFDLLRQQMAWRRNQDAQQQIIKNIR